MKATATTPSTLKSRIVGLDVMRGFALLGIALMNIEFFHRPHQGYNFGFEQGLEGINATVAWWVFALVQGKFWMLFSFLFGLGFAVLCSRFGDDHRGFSSMYKRRLLALFVMGVGHGVLLWAGDILAVYAITGVFLLWFAKRMSGRWALRLGLLLQLSMFALFYFTAAMGALVRLGGEDGMAGMAEYEEGVMVSYHQAAEVYAQSSWWAVTGQRASDFTELLAYSIFFMMPGVLGMFLLGVWAWRSGVFRMPEDHRRTHRWLLAGLLPGALLAVWAMRLGLDSSTPLDMTWSYAHGQTLMWVASLLLCLGYASASMWWLIKLGWITQGMAALGRMALTNYLLQSLVFGTVMYGYAGAQFGLWQRHELIALVFGFYVVQMLLSACWLHYARFGPMEWLWRWFSYRKRPVLWKSSVA